MQGPKLATDDELEFFCSSLSFSAIWNGGTGNLTEFFYAQDIFAH